MISGSLMSSTTATTKRNRIYNESLRDQEPIRFITARRFWILVYLLLGTSGLAMLLARFLIRPIVAKVVRAQQQYHAHVNAELKSFVANLAKSITALPGRQIIVDTTRHRLFVNTETQTDAADAEEQEPESTDKQKSSELTKLSSIPQKLEDMGQSTEEDLYNDLTQKMSDFKSYLYELDSASYKTSYSGFGSSSSGSSSGGDAIQKFKAEIRSVKGTMLNARTFTASPRIGTVK